MLSESARSAVRDPSTPAVKSERLAVRVNQSQRALLTEASRAAETTLSEFVLTAATRAAQDVLADRRRFVLPRAQWNEFVKLLDAPPRSLPRLRQLLEAPSPLDEA